MKILQVLTSHDQLGNTGRKESTVTGFTKGEEEAEGLTKVVPFLVEDELLRLGAIFEKKANWEPFTITDGHLVTGQNLSSAYRPIQRLPYPRF